MISIVAFFFLFLRCDAAVLWCIRKILNQFLMGSTNKRQNKEIKKNITACEKLTMSYVGQYINKNEKEKRCYARYYLFYRIALVVVPVVLAVTTIMYAH